MTYRIIETDVHLKREIICSPQLSGYELNIVVAGYQGKLIMPQIRDEWKHKFKESSGFSSIWQLRYPSCELLKFNEDSEWGRVCNSDGVISVERCVVSFTFKKYQHYKVAAKSIASAINNYMDELLLFIEVITGSICKSNGNKKISTHTSSFETIYNGKIRYLNTASTTVEMYFVMDTVGMQSTEMQNAADLVNQELKPHIAHCYLRDARKAVQERDNRKSIIDVGTALEIALTEICKKKLLTDNSNKFTDIALKKFRTLGGRLMLADSLGFDLFEQRNIIQQKVIALRNDAVHNGQVHTREEVNEAIEIATKIIKHYCKYYEDYI